MYDVSNRESFEEIVAWFAGRSVLAHPSAVKVLVGNKIDQVLLHLC